MSHEHRRYRLDRTDHERAIESRRHDRRGPSRRAIKDALDEVADHAIPGTPRAGAVKILRDGVAFPVEVEDRHVTDARIKRGDPQHGAHRSDDHISRYVVETPLAGISNEAVPGSVCPHCGGTDAEYSYRAHHYIAGGEAVECLTCGETLHSEEWG